MPLIRILFFALFTYPVCALAQEPITPLQSISGLSPQKIKLGKQLFNDVRLSKNNTISCASCHLLNINGADNLAVAIGINGKKGTVKTPTVYNSVFNIAQFWDGRSRTLEQQVSGPIHDPVEMGSNWIEVTQKLSRDSNLRRQFDALYSTGITASTIADAIATFERSLVTVEAPFDQWLQGDKAALSEDAKQGYNLFKAYGCISCHQGKNVGGNMFAYMGAMGNYFADRGTALTKADLGRFNVTGDDDDKHLFKVPSLRLAALQTHFFHDASATNLEDAIQIMARYQLGRQISKNDTRKIAHFLHSLVGRHPELNQP